jgi:hypothetical protein
VWADFVCQVGSDIEELKTTSQENSEEYNNKAKVIKGDHMFI